MYEEEFGDYYGAVMAVCKIHYQYVDTSMRITIIMSNTEQAQERWQDMGLSCNMLISLKKN